MSNIKERIFGALTVMSEEDALNLWNIITEKFSVWSNIENVEPDEWDLKMIADIENSSDNEYISSDKLKAELGLI